MSFWRACAISARSIVLSRFLKSNKIEFGEIISSKLRNSSPFHFGKIYPSTQQSFPKTSPSNRARRTAAERPSYLRPRLFLELFDASMIRIGSNDCNNFHFAWIAWLFQISVGKVSVKDITSSFSDILRGKNLEHENFRDKNIGWFYVTSRQDVL